MRIPLQKYPFSILSFPFNNKIHQLYFLNLNIYYSLFQSYLFGLNIFEIKSNLILNENKVNFEI